GTGDTIAFFVEYPEPTIASYTPNFGMAGDYVIITGTNLANIKSVQFSSEFYTQPINALVMDSVSTGELRVMVPDYASGGPIVITTSSGTAQTSGSYNVIYNAPAVNEETSPNTGYIGEDIEIEGINFQGIRSISFNGSEMGG